MNCVHGVLGHSFIWEVCLSIQPLLGDARREMTMWHFRSRLHVGPDWGILHRDYTVVTNEYYGHVDIE